MRAHRRQGFSRRTSRPAPARSRSVAARSRSVAGQVFLLHLSVVVLLVLAAVAALVLQARSTSLQEARDRSLVGAQAFAQAPGTRAAMQSEDPSALLQPRAEEARKRSGVTYVIAFSPAGVRWTHPDADLIGRRVVGSVEEALTHRVHQATYDTPGVGRSVDTMVAVRDPEGRVVGLVSVGITVQSVNTQVTGQLPLLATSAAGALLLATAGSALVSRRLRRQTHGLDPAEMTRMYEHHDAVLHAVREGVVVVSGKGRLLLANDEARRLLDLPADAEQRPVTDLGLEPDTAALLASGRSTADEVHLAGGRLLAVNLRPVDGAGAATGSVATLRDTTELRALSGRAELARDRLQLLYDAGVRIGTTLDVERTARELAEVAVGRFADFVTVDLMAAVPRGEEPDDGTDLVRTVVHGVNAEHPFLPAGEPIVHGTEAAKHEQALLVRDLNASADLPARDPECAERLREQGVRSLISVPLRAHGVVLGTVGFWRSASPRFGQEDLFFAEELAARAAVAVDNARHYTREHTLAVALQRSLLPHALPEHPGVEVAHRYLPADAGVGGDWFDVIPLPGARVALVVGDVVGHGLHAAATMGRLRTAVHNFSALDLPPDELLGRLDELVAGIDQGEPVELDGTGVTGATCLYAIYDPASGVCSIARAGHPGPAVILPDGRAHHPEVPVSPPLGLGGGLPFETAEILLPEGSQLALYTDGLVEDRTRDIDAGLELLRGALARPGRTPEETCRAALATMLPAGTGDDVALLVARTRLLDPDRVAEWDVPGDPAAVAGIRADVSRRLESWGLDEVSFTAELLISELVTNAIRYGAAPIRLRLLHDGAGLICEVADGSSTSPHLRRAKSTDEGGRGLFLVAQFAQRWGTRYTARGKVIWTELPVQEGESAGFVEF